MKKVGGFLRLFIGPSWIKANPPGNGLQRRIRPRQLTAAQISVRREACITSCLPANPAFWLMLAFQ